jgi:AcrR family transcriptional regulator
MSTTADGAMIANVETSMLVAHTSRLARIAVPRRFPEQRRAQILVEAAQFFSEHGFAGPTRELARQVGVSQPLLFRYFESKEDLFDVVFDTVFSGQWRDEWSNLICDHSCPLRERLLAFYDVYLPVVFNRQWMRLYAFSGLSDIRINTRYFRIIEQRFLRPLCVEVRAEFGMIGPEALPITNDELDYIWSFHGGIFYHGIRHYAFGSERPGATVLGKDLLRVLIGAFVEAAPRVVASFLEAKGCKVPSTSGRKRHRRAVGKAGGSSSTDLLIRDGM